MVVVGGWPAGLIGERGLVVGERQKIMKRKREF